MWQRYPRIHNICVKNLSYGAECNEWVGLEKIHGVNFAIEIKNKSFNYFRRNGTLSNETFYDYRETMKKYRSDFEFLYSKLGECVLYGEYFGKNVQSTIHYSSDYNFIPFDILVGDTFLTWDKFSEIIKKTSFIQLKPIIEGPLSKIYNMDVNNVPSTITNAGSFIEGIVIRPKNRDLFIQGTRILFKKKADKFSEKRFKQVDKKGYKLDEQKYLNIKLAYINENRLDSVLSKETEFISMANIQTIVKKLLIDAQEDWESDESKYILEFDPKRAEKLDKIVKGMAFKLVRIKLT